MKVKVLTLSWMQVVIADVAPYSSGGSLSRHLGGRHKSAALHTLLLWCLVARYRRHKHDPLDVMLEEVVYLLHDRSFVSFGSGAIHHAF